jgi:hypothetical protein
MLHQSSTVVISAGSCWLFLLLGWAAAVNNNIKLPDKPIPGAGGETSHSVLSWGPPVLHRTVAALP